MTQPGVELAPVRREYADRLLILSGSQMGSVLAEFQAHHNDHRHHQPVRRTPLADIAPPPNARASMVGAPDRSARRPDPRLPTSNVTTEIGNERAAVLDRGRFRRELGAGVWIVDVRHDQHRALGAHDDGLRCAAEQPLRDEWASMQAQHDQCCVFLASYGENGFRY